MKIMIADDHRLVAEGIKTKLTELGPDIEFIIAMTVPEMMKLACDDLDLVLIDLKMPGTEGYEHLEAMRRRFPTVPLVVVSGYDDPALMREALERGAQGFIPKACSPDILLSAVRLVLAEGIYVPQKMVMHELAGAHGKAGGAATAPAASRPAALMPAPLMPARLMPAAEVAESPAALTLEVLHEMLTKRQMQVLVQLSHGQPNKLIARSLGISEGTVKIHLAAIFRALKAQNRTEAAVTARTLVEDGATMPMAQ